MKSIVVYYSLTGNTDYAAKAIAKEMDAELLRLETVAPYPAGAKRFLAGGKAAMTNETPELKPYEFDGAQYDTVILGMPLWAWTVCPPLRTFLKEQNLKGKKIGLFICSMGGQDRKCYGKLEELTGAENAPRLTLLDPKTRPNDKNAIAIREFAETMKKR